MNAKITQSKFLISSPSYDLCPVADKPEYAFIGRSNVGKSSLINMICDKKELVKTSAKPGKTQLINYFSIDSVGDDGDQQSWYLVDLPGYGYAKVTKDKRHAWQDMIAEYILQRENLAQICVLIDSRHKPQQIDIEFINRLEEQGRSFCIVFTKSDQVNQKDLHANLKLFMAELSKTFQTLPGYFVTSSLKKGSGQDLVNALHELNASLEEEAE